MLDSIITSSPITGTMSRTTDICAAMSLSKLLTPPLRDSDMPDASSPTLHAEYKPADAPSTTDKVAVAHGLPSPPLSISAEPKVEPSLASESMVIDKDDSGAASDAAEPIVREFTCMNDEFAECKTGQYTLDLSRKVISDHFGRNKACTRLIADWPLFCRKHYQRATYNGGLWQMRKVTLILRQFDVIEAQIPGVTYTVALKKSEEQRLNVYSRKVASGATPKEAAMAVQAEPGKHFEAPIDVLRELQFRLGPNKTMAECQETTSIIHEMLQTGETAQVPAIEFLMQVDTAGRPNTITSDRTKCKPRVTKKGAIQKVSSKKPPPKGKGKGKGRGKA